MAKKQIPIYLSPEMHEKLKEISMEKLDGINLNRTVNLLIRDYRIVKIGTFHPLKNRTKINKDE